MQSLERKTNHTGASVRILFKIIKLAIMSYLDNVLFAIVLAIGFGYFFSKYQKNHKEHQSWY
jgi:hypothetical protein